MKYLINTKSKEFGVNVDLEVLAKNFDLILDAPNSVPKLREYILQLAVQGKLVPQDPNDEPASELLKKIKAEKDKLIAEGKIKKEKPLEPIKAEDIPFEIPKNWEWSYLTNLGCIFNGNSINEDLKKTKYEKISDGLPYLSTKDIGYGELNINYENGVKIPFDEPSFKISKKNNILICSEGGSAGKKIALTNQDICFGNKLITLDPFKNVIPMFIFYLYQTPSFFEMFKSKMTGIIGGISINEFKSLIIPLPPLEEQKRIVERVEQLMKYCDQLEEKQKEVQEKRINFNLSATHHLTNSDNKDDFNKYLQLINDNFDFLYDEPKNVKQLRETILQLAVQGKLININNEIYLQESKLENLILFKPKNGYSPKSVDYITKVKNLTLTSTTSGSFNDNFFKYIDEDIPLKSHLWLKKGDILVQRGNSIDYVGIAAIYNGEDYKFIYPDLMIKFRANEEVILTEFLHLNLISINTRKYFRENSSGTSGSMPKINQKVLVNTNIIFPQIKYQKLILEVYKKLMKYCDELEANIEKSNKDRQALMYSVLSSSLKSKTKELSIV